LVKGKRLESKNLTKKNAANQKEVGSGDIRPQNVAQATSRRGDGGKAEGGGDKMFFSPVCRVGEKGGIREGAKKNAVSGRVEGVEKKTEGV